MTDPRMAQAMDALAENDLDAAEACCRQLLLTQDAEHADALHVLGHIMGRRGERDQALALLERAVARAPRHPQYRYNLAVSLGEAGRENEAALHYQACLRQQPTHRDALWNYGEMLRLAEHFERAADLFLRFEQGGGDYPALQHRLAVCFSALRRDEEAHTRFGRALNEPAQDPLTRWEHALHLLSRERFAEGFAEYRHRFASQGRNSVYCHDFGLAPWPGSFDAGAGQTLLVHGEQGLGDEMMFASVLPELLADAERAGAQVVLAVKPPVVRLFAASFPQALVRAHKVGAAPLDLAGLPPITWQLPIGDLPYFYRRGEADFGPAARAYLCADPQRSAWYDQQIALLEPPGAPAPRLRVGLMWGSNPAPVNAKFMRWTQQRSIPVQMFERLAHRVPEVRFVSVQNHERGPEAALAPALDIFDFSALQTDFAETAALIGALDLVISVDTSVSHLAGGLGKPCWVPLMKRPDWRHGLVRDTSLWYSGTRYFRQSAHHQWGDVLDRIDAAVGELLADAPLRQSPPPAAPRPASAATPPAATPERPALAQAIAHLDARDLPAARRFFDLALAREPHSSTVQWEAAMEALTAQDWGRGWDLHEARLRVFGWERLNLCPLPWPAWQGEALEGRTIVVHGEQGIGDEIMYASLLPDLLARGARVILACTPPLAALLRDAFPTVQVVPHPRGNPAAWHHALPAWAGDIGPVDFQSPLGSLARWLRRNGADFPRQPYLRADPARVERMRAHLEARQPAAGALRVGVAWCGNLDNPHGRAKSLTPEQLLPLAQVPGVQLVSLQSRQYAADAQRVPGLNLLDMSAHTDDFADLAALAVQMDLVISIDSSYVHLCGALGLPVWLPLRRNCDWRWGWRQSDSVWYPGLRLFHQPVDGDWQPVLDELREALRHRAASPPRPNGEGLPPR